jgi:hypothetical protein
MRPRLSLPQQTDLPVKRLAAVFNNTTATYKFYWFISLLEILVEKQERVIPMRNILARMICNVWYPVHFFRISFGHFDMLSQNAQRIRDILDIPININKEQLYQQLLAVTDTQVGSLISHFDQMVPYRFLSPWFPAMTNNQVVKHSLSFSEDCLYRIISIGGKKYIDINPRWEIYLNLNYRILLDFCFWNLTLYLQPKNPNVPDIPGKLIKPATRGSVAKQKQYWDLVLEQNKEVSCIYTSDILEAGAYDVEHYIPYSFVTHNLIWNLIPASPGINSAKSNKLPPQNRFFNSFVQTQQNGLRTVYNNTPSNKLLEDYLQFGTAIPELVRMEPEQFRDRYLKIFTPLYQIAENMGFEYWDHRNS